VTVLHWEELHAAPAQPGIYAWYYQIRIPKADIQTCITDLRAAPQQSEALDIVRNFFDRMIYKYIGETPYDVLLSGALKPTYEGTAKFAPTLSNSFLQSIVDNPDSLTHLADMLSRTIPHFASPLYIGMSTNLRRRLKQHREAITAAQTPGVRVERPAEWSVSEHAFAVEVRRRALPLPSLRVVVQPTPSSLEPKLIEYLLNRSCYPVFGRR
jgi:hypothetical protein